MVEENYDVEMQDLSGFIQDLKDNQLEEKNKNWFTDIRVQRIFRLLDAVEKIHGAGIRNKETCELEVFLAELALVHLTDSVTSRLRNVGKIWELKKKISKDAKLVDVASKHPIPDLVVLIHQKIAMLIEHLRIYAKKPRRKFGENEYHKIQVLIALYGFPVYSLPKHAAFLMHNTRAIIQNGKGKLKRFVWHEDRSSSVNLARFFMMRSLACIIIGRRKTEKVTNGMILEKDIFCNNLCRIAYMIDAFLSKMPVGGLKQIDRAGCRKFSENLGKYQEHYRKSLASAFPDPRKRPQGSPFDVLKSEPVDCTGISEAMRGDFRELSKEAITIPYPTKLFAKFGYNLEPFTELFKEMPVMRINTNPGPKETNFPLLDSLADNTDVIEQKHLEVLNSLVSSSTSEEYFTTLLSMVGEFKGLNFDTKEINRIVKDKVAASIQQDSVDPGLRELEENSHFIAGVGTPIYKDLPRFSADTCSFSHTVMESQEIIPIGKSGYKKVFDFWEAVVPDNKSEPTETTLLIMIYLRHFKVSTEFIVKAFDFWEKIANYAKKQDKKMLERVSGFVCLNKHDLYVSIVFGAFADNYGEWCSRWRRNIEELYDFFCRAAEMNPVVAIEAEQNLYKCFSYLRRVRERQRADQLLVVISDLLARNERNAALNLVMCEDNWKKAGGRFDSQDDERHFVQWVGGVIDLLSEGAEKSTERALRLVDTSSVDFSEFLQAKGGAR